MQMDFNYKRMISRRERRKHISKKERNFAKNKHEQYASTGREHMKRCSWR
ncbi:MAG: hypothetical protein ABH857_04240 [Elusimicrobiota bacterium]